MDAPEHYTYYQSLVDQEPHRDTDFYSAAELQAQMEAHEVDAWIARDASGPIGWCAVIRRSPHHPLNDSVHLLGSIIALPYRGQGLGAALVEARLALFSHQPITASVLPGNVPSERMLRRAGFRPGLMQGAWCTWHRPSRAHPMVLLDDAEQVKALLAQGVYAEVDRPPVEGGDGRILRGLWPDAAAFHAVPYRA